MGSTRLGRAVVARRDTRAADCRSDAGVFLDPDRVYLTGQSLGGHGTWDIISKRPDLFAAAVPLCGNGNPSRVAAARRLPIWAFHGAQNPLVPVTGSRDLVAALRAVGSPVKYTEYPDVGHDVWTVPTWIRRWPMALQPAADDPLAVIRSHLMSGRVRLWSDAPFEPAQAVSSMIGQGA